MNNPTLAVSLFFHLVATAVWIGGLLLTVITIQPSMRAVLAETPQLEILLTRLRRRLTPLFNLSLAVLVTTGLFQMSLDEHYEGVMQISNVWSQVMLVKHIVIVCMVMCGVYLQFSVAPNLERATMLISKGKGSVEEIAKLRQTETRLTWASALLGVAVLGFSAWAGSI